MADPDFLTNEPLATYVPVPFPANFPRPGDCKPCEGGGTGPGPGDGDGNGNGEEVYAAALFVRAACQATDVVGAWVRAADAASTVTTTTSQLSYPAIGVIVSKASDTACVVQTYGLCDGIYAGLAPNVRLFVGPDGKAATGVSLPSGTAYVQPVGFAVRSTTLFVQPSGTLYRRDAAASNDDPAPPASGDGTSTYRPILNGPGTPDDSIGQLADVYLQTTTLLLYGPKQVAGWGQPRALAASGAPGAQGEPGSRIYRVAALPHDGTGYRAFDLLIDDDGNVAQVENA